MVTDTLWVIQYDLLDDGETRCSIGFDSSRGPVVVAATRPSARSALLDAAARAFEYAQ